MEYENIYIVTDGDYSEYIIKKVFLDKEKAEKYAKLSTDGYYQCEVEEWDTSDDKLIDEITYIYVEYKKEKRISFNIEFVKTNTLDDKKGEIDYTDFSYMDYSSIYDEIRIYKELTLRREITGNYDEENLKKKYKKVCHDVMAKIESLMELEGWTEEMIQEWLGQNIDKYEEALN